MRAVKDQRYTLEEYFELERNSEEKWEYWDGHVWCMSGASPLHERIVVNLSGHLRDKLRGRGCSIFSSNLKMLVPDYSTYRYPDLTVFCGNGEFVTVGGLEVLTNPQMIIEVLSPLTEAFDRGVKFTYYKSIPSLTDYLLVSTDMASVGHFLKNGENDWSHAEGNGLDASILLKTFDIELQLSEVYLDIELPEPIYRSGEDDLYRG